MPKIEMGKKYKTKSGTDVRVLCVDRECDYPVVALMGAGIEIYTEDGVYDIFGIHDHMNLVEVKEKHKRTVWMNVYPNHVYGVESKEEASWAAHLQPIARIAVEIEYEEGEGL